MSRESYAAGGQYSSSSSKSSSTSSSGGGDARESYGGGGQYSTTPSPAPSVTTGGGDNVVDPGFVKALEEQAKLQTDPVFGDPDPYVDVPLSERDTITSFLDNFAANVKANPFEFGLLGALKTLYQTEQAKNMLLDTPGYEFLRDYSIPTETPIGGDQQSRDVMTGLVSQLPYTISGATPQESMVNQYFANMGSMGQSLSSNLQTSYNNAKTNINNLLGIITPPSQQFGYSAQPYSGLVDVDYLKQRGLI